MKKVIIGSAELYLSDCIEAIRTMPDNSIDSIVTDPPYELGFMGKGWDKSGIANNAEMWREALRVLKPGGHLLAFGGSRTYHRMACAIEESGFEIRDQIMWVYGSGFPKSMDVAKAIKKRDDKIWEDMDPCDRLADMNEMDAKHPGWDTSESQWEGWGTALKPAHEPICVSRKPLIGTVAENVLKYGVGGLNINGCRVEPTGESRERVGEASQDRRYTDAGGTNFAKKPGIRGGDQAGRWPANFIHDGSDEVLSAFPDAKGQQGNLKETGRDRLSSGRFGNMPPPHAHTARIESETNAGRFFYCAKTSKSDRNDGTESLPKKKGGMVSNTSGQHITRRDEGYEAPLMGNTHPTVKPTDLMAYLCRLVTPLGGVVLDPFMGSGSTGKACMREGFRFVGCELEPEYLAIAAARIAYEQELVKESNTPPAPTPQLDLFQGAAS